MHRKNVLITICFVIATLGIVATSAWGGAQEIKARMAERLPVITELKQNGIVGENNQGLLEFVGTAKEKADVVEAENKDRKIVYKAIAKKTGTTPEIVGRRRAQQIAQNAKGGEYVQDEAGQWQKK
ncbi:MAG: YdbL family protein [Thermodesulfobacteriota bacterium]